MSWIVVICFVLLAGAAVLTMIRVERGPAMLDRMVALDILVTVIIAGVAVEAAWSQRTDTVPILVALSLVGFVGSVTVARFASVEPADQRRILTRAEARAADTERRERELADDGSDSDDGSGAAYEASDGGGKESP